MAMAQGTRLRLGLCSFKHPFLWNNSPSIASTTTTTAGPIQTCLCLTWLFRLLHSNALNPLPQRSPAFPGVRYMQRQLPFQRLFCSEATGDKEKMKKKPVNTKTIRTSIEAKKEIEKSKLPPPYDPFNKKPVIEDPDNPKDLQFIFHKMRSEGLINNAVKMFDALSKDGLTHEALELFSQIKDKGHMPDVVAHTAVVEAYANAGQSKEALKVFLRMLACGVAPNVYTYSVLIKALAADGKLADANKYIMEMMSKGMRPNAATYTAVFEAYAKEQKEDQAREFLQQMKEKGFVPDEKAVREILNKRGQVFRTVINILFK
ncbi:hypothetical protein MANES_04G038100v8 [Manihot esculenta]|uniref:Uncharacterized protein n=1 Tax=Manihot esculenta TaxID=3983 RepID=A0ACB7HRK0_MANES|nr:hypothetical protein MANES_04G038100v8 [Manihot esculenta]